LSTAAGKGLAIVEAIDNCGMICSTALVAGEAPPTPALAGVDPLPVSANSAVMVAGLGVG
jgi:hypothetical protein